jgi:peroxiredoxin
LKKIFGILLIVGMIVIVYVENKSDPTLNPLAPFQHNEQAEAEFDQLIDVDEGYVSSAAASNDYPFIEEGDKAPDFTLKTLSGETVNLSQYEGKTVILNFWATWCPPCKEELPAMQKFYDKNQGKVEILAINIDPENNVKKYKQEMGLTFPILLDSNEKVNNQYGIIAIPTTIVIDENGKITKKHIGALTEESFTTLMD